jgi:WD40 repeat protein
VGGLIKVYNISGGLVNSFQAHTDGVSRLKQLDNGYVASVSYDKTAKIWDVSNYSKWVLIRSYTRHIDTVYGLEYIDTDTIATGSSDFTLHIWSICTGLNLRTINAGIDVFSLKLLSNGYHLVAGLGNGKINIYDLNDGSLVKTLTGHTTKVRDFVFLSDSNLLASSSSDSKVRIWNLTTSTCKFILTGHTDTIYALKLVSTDVIASGSRDKKVILWNVTSGTLIQTLTGHSLDVQWSVDMLTDGSQTLVSGSADATIKYWNINTGACLNTINTGFAMKALVVLTSKITDNRSKFFYIDFL